MEKNNFYRIRIEDLIILTQILNDFEAFNSNLMDLRANSFRDNIDKDLSKVSHGKFVFMGKTLQKFYEQNKKVIDTINTQRDIRYFLFDNYDVNGKLSCFNLLKTYHAYLLEHKDKISQILELLEKLKELGITTLELSPDSDFTLTTYTLGRMTFLDSKVEYLDNIEIIPRAYRDDVTYRSLGSDYKITVTFNHLSSEMYDFGRHIIVNNLLFSPEKLPKELTKETTLDYILKKAREKQNTCKSLEELVNLSVNIDDLTEQFASTSKVVEKMINTPDAKETLSKLQDCLAKLKTLGDSHSSKILSSDAVLTPELLKAEKEVYLRRRKTDYFDVW